MLQPVDSDDYIWCRRCSALLPELAKFCRLCGNATEEAALQQVQPDGLALSIADRARHKTNQRNPWGRLVSGVERFQSYSYACKWLPSLENMVEHLPPGKLRERLMEIASEEPDEMKSAPAIDTLIGYQLQPEKEVVDLIWRVVIGLNGSTTPLKDSDKRRLELLGMSAEKIKQERDWRNEERESGKRCPFCAEYCKFDLSHCRFCESVLPDGPFDIRSKRSFKIDEQYMHDLYVFLGALSELDLASKPALLSEAIQSNDVSIDEIAARARQLTAYKGSYEQELPLTQWEKKLIAAGEPHKRTQFGAIRNMLTLARNCRLSGKDSDHELIMLTALGLARSKQTDEFVQDFIFAELGAEQAFITAPRIRPQGQVINIAPPETVDFSPGAPDASTPDPHAPADEEEVNAPMAAAQNLVDVLTGGLFSGGDLLKNVLHGSDKQRADAIKRLTGSIQDAQSMIAGMINGATGGAPQPDAEHQRAIQMTSLADIYLHQGKNVEAETLLTDAAEIARTNPGIEAFNVSLIYRQVAAGFEKMAKLYKAKEFYELSIKNCQMGISEMSKKFPETPLNTDMANLLDAYAGVLRKLELDTLADAVEAQARNIRANC